MVFLITVSEGPAEDPERETFFSESVEFESEEEYREKLETLKESYFSRTVTRNAQNHSASQQTLSEGVDSTPAPMAQWNGIIHEKTGEAFQILNLILFKPQTHFNVQSKCSNQNHCRKSGHLFSIMMVLIQSKIIIVEL